jgi:hypothetical protein
MANKEPAIITGKLVLNCPLKVARPEESVIMLRSVLTINGHIRSPYANTAVNTARAAMEDFVRGAITFTNACHWLQPSR